MLLKGFKRHYLILIFLGFQATLAQSLPYLANNQLFVSNLPYTILGGELGNSTASSAKGMEGVWEKLSTLHINTLLVPVYWELVEPQPNQFDFSRLEALMRKSEENNLKLVSLWFGTWKNSMSTYVPQGIKTNAKKYPRTQNEEGENQEILSPFSKAVLAADRNAFEHLMQFIKKADPTGQRVVDLYLNEDQTLQGRHLNIPVNQYQIQPITLYTY